MTLRTNARIAGFAFLFYIAAGITQMVLGAGTSAQGTAARLVLISQHASQVRVVVVLALVICVTAMVLAVALYGITREVDRDLAVLALSFRLGEGMLSAIAPMATLGLLWLATAGAGTGVPDAVAANALGAYLLKVQGWNITITATLFAVGSTLFSWLLLRGRMIPTPLAWLGVVTSVLLVVGLPLRLVGVVPDSVIQLLWLPMAAFEIPLALWLLIKRRRHAGAGSHAMTLLPIHIIAGSTALVAGSVALYALKGARVHRKSGMMFVCAMIVLGITGVVMATLKLNQGNQMGGVLAVYFVTTGLLTIRRPVARFDWKDLGATLMALTVAAAGLTFGLGALRSPTGTKDGYPPALYFVFGAVALLAVFGDLRMLVGGVQGSSRIARHVWRMCVGLFIASGSFFLGQAQVFPKQIRIMPLLAIPALLPLVLMLYWLGRVLITKRYSRRAGDSLEPVGIRLGRIE